MSNIIRERLSLPGVAEESTNPIKYQIIDGNLGTVVTDQSRTDADIMISMTEGLGGALLKARIYNMAQSKIDLVKDIARKNNSLIVKLGYNGYNFEEVGKFILLDQEQSFIPTEKIVKGSFNRILELRGLEQAAWVCQHVRISYSSQNVTPAEHVINIIARANKISPIGKIAVASSNIEGAKPVYFESHYTTVATILLNLAESFGYTVQAIGNTIIFIEKAIDLRKSLATIDGEKNTLEFTPLFEYSPPKTLETDTEFSSQIKTVTGYSFEILGNPNILMWSQVDAKNVDFEKGERETRKRDDLIVIEVEHNYNSRSGYLCRGRLISKTKIAPRDPYSSSTPHGSTEQSFIRAVSNLTESVVRSDKSVVVGDITSIDDEDYSKEYRLTVTAGMDLKGVGKEESRHSRLLDIPKSEDESSMFRLIDRVSILSQYMGHGYGLFFPSSYDENINQRVVILNHNNENDPLLIGYVFTNKMSSDSESFPKHNSGDIYLHTRAHSKLLFPTRIDEATTEEEIGSGVLQTKSLVIEVGETYLTVTRPTPDSPNKVRITQKTNGTTNHIILNDDGKIKIIHAASSEDAGDSVIILNGTDITLEADSFTLNGDLSVDGTIDATGKVSGSSGEFG